MYKIAICGKANSGKDTVSNMICNQIKKSLSNDQTTVILSFADPIKQMIQLMYPQIDRKYLFGESSYRNKIISGSFKNNQPLTIRQLLQDLGEGCKVYNHKIWVDVLHDRCQKFEDEGYNAIIVSDLRFLIEYEYLLQHDFYFIKVKRNDIDNISHISETQQDQLDDSKFNFIIHNNGSLVDLELKVKQMPYLNK